MARKMWQAQRKLSAEETEALLTSGKEGVLAVNAGTTVIPMPCR